MDIILYPKDSPEDLYCRGYSILKIKEKLKTSITFTQDFIKFKSSYTWKEFPSFRREYVACFINENFTKEDLLELLTKSMNQRVSLRKLIEEKTECEYHSISVGIIYEKKGLQKEYSKFKKWKVIFLKEYCEKFGVENVSQLEDVKRKKIQTSLDHYGVTNPMFNDSVKAKLKNSLLEKYGVENISKLKKIKEQKKNTLEKNYCSPGETYSDYYRKKFKQFAEEKGVTNTSQLEEIKRKKEKTTFEHYGVKNPFESEIIKDKIASNNLQKYGVKHNAQRADVRAKMEKTNYERYGGKSSSCDPRVVKKGYETRRKNGTFNTSSPETSLHNRLLEMYSNVENNYNKDSRYPFHCDFYIPDRDLFVELNLHWTHGGHWFDKNDTDDLAKVDKWKKKDSKFYDMGINNWTVRDLKKRQTAQKNNLNYVVLWTVLDIEEWLSLGCPNGYDWKEEYTWRKNNEKTKEH